jgi:DNA repair exonuclease SbcCD ATPase subunit
MSDLLIPPGWGSDQPVGPPPTRTTPPRSSRAPWIVTGLTATLLVVVSASGLGYVSQLRAEIRDLEGQLAIAADERAVVETDRLSLEDERTAFEQEVATFREVATDLEARAGELSGVESQLASCQLAAERSMAFTAEFAEWRQMDAAWWASAEGSEEERNLGLALEAELSALRDSAAALNFAADACLAQAAGD